jgi:serine/threonine-protein kinase
LQHPNIVQSLDVVQRDGELLLVMEYVDGVTLNSVCHDALAAQQQIPLKVVTGIIVPVLHGLHAAHVAKDDDGNTLGIVHRDFSPQNIIIGRDGNAKILDFGIAKARSHHHVTATGQFSGKFGYLSPEQVRGKAVDQRTDVFAAGVVLWELLSGKRLFREPGLSEATTVERVLNMEIVPPSRFNAQVDASLDEIAMRALQREPDLRFGSARELAVAIESAHPMGSSSLISGYLQEVSGPRLERLSGMLANVRRHVVVAARHDRSPSRPGNPSPIEPGQTVVSVSPARDSVETELMAERPNSSRRVTVVVGLTLLLVVGMLARVLNSRLVSPTSLEASAVTPADNTGSDVIATGQPKASEALAVDPAGTAASSALPEALKDSTQMSEPASRPPQRGSSKTNVAHAHATTDPARATKSTTAVSAKAHCDPPTYIDSEGIRHFKAGCL